MTLVLRRSSAEALTVETYVRPAAPSVNATPWESSVSLVPGDQIDVLVKVENRSGRTVDNLMVGVNLPDYLSADRGGTRIINGNNPDGLKIENENTTRGGISIGHYNPGAVGYVWFTATVDQRSAFRFLRSYALTLTGLARAEGLEEFSTAAQLRVDVESAPAVEEA